MGYREDSKFLRVEEKKNDMMNWIKVRMTFDYLRAILEVKRKLGHASKIGGKWFSIQNILSSQTTNQEFQENKNIFTWTKSSDTGQMLQ